MISRGHWEAKLQEMRHYKTTYDWLRNYVAKHQRMPPMLDFFLHLAYDDTVKEKKSDDSGRTSSPA